MARPARDYTPAQTRPCTRRLTPLSGEHLLNDIDMHALGYECAKHVPGERATHVFLRKHA